MSCMLTFALPLARSWTNQEIWPDWLTNLQEGDVLFIDEIHRLSPVVEEYLYSAMEDFQIDIMIDKGPSARSVQLYS